MAFRRRRFSRRRVARRPVARRARARRPVRSRAGVKKVVKQVLSRIIEVKGRQSGVKNRALYYPGQSSLYDPNNTLALGLSTDLNIQQGVGQGARVGNKIHIKRLTWNCVFTPSTYSGTTNMTPEPVMVKLVFFYERDTPTVNPVPRTDFFQLDNSAAAIVGALTDMVAPFNTDQYRILGTKTFKLGNSSYEGTGNNAGAQYYANNDFRLNQLLKFDLTKWIPKLVRYDDNSVIPTSRGLWVQIMVAPADGSVGESGVVPASVRYWSEIKYTDA